MVIWLVIKHFGLQRQKCILTTIVSRTTRSKLLHLYGNFPIFQTICFLEFKFCGAVACAVVQDFSYVAPTVIIRFVGASLLHIAAVFDIVPYFPRLNRKVNWTSVRILTIFSYINCKRELNLLPHKWGNVLVKPDATRRNIFLNYTWTEVIKQKNIAQGENFLRYCSLCFARWYKIRQTR